MYRTAFVLLLLAVKLPMMAEEVAGVTVHQAEWGDTRGETSPPSGPAVPVKENDAAPIFQAKPTRYGDNLRYGTGAGRPSGIRYAPQTRLMGSSFRQTRRSYQPNIRYAGSFQRSRGYRSTIRYSPEGRARSGIRYGSR